MTAMRNIAERRTKARPPAVPPLENGERLSQAEFHRRYEAYPQDVKFELVGGVVHMASPLGRKHGTCHPEMSTIFCVYKSMTPGIEVLDNATIILGEESESQPDLALRILPEYGGQSHTRADHVLGSPELMAEIAHSTRSIDLHEKKDDYQRAGALEYLVACLEEEDLHWFNFKLGRNIKPDRDGVYRSRVFPGLWIHGPALIARDSRRLIEVVQQGLASREHAAFVKRLQAAHRKRS
jgi:Uma2 family endonuclease